MYGQKLFFLSHRRSLNYAFEIKRHVILIATMQDTMAAVIFFLVFQRRRRFEIWENETVYNKQLLDEVEHDIMRKPSSIIVLLYIFHIMHPQKQK